MKIINIKQGGERNYAKRVGEGGPKAGGELLGGGHLEEGGPTALPSHLKQHPRVLYPFSVPKFHREHHNLVTISEFGRRTPRVGDWPRVRVDVNEEPRGAVGTKYFGFD